MTEPYRTPAAPLLALVDELVSGGVRDVVICPGSRSTPLALALRASPTLRCWVHLDERAGAFFALGAAKAARRPAAILATSGTAVVNFAPAVAEARYGRVPLILLTADRPPELQGVGAPQTIDQVELYGRHAKWFAELPVPDDAPEAEVELRSTVARAVQVAAAAPAGPVQLNVPFREPLLPDGPIVADPVAAVSVSRDEPTVIAPESIEPLLPLAHAAARPLIVCGPLDRPGLAAALSRFAGALRAPVLADVLANLRSGSHDRERVIRHHDVFLRSAWFVAQPAPDLIVRFGGTPTSKVLNRALEGWPAPQLLVDDGGGWNVPAGDAIEPIDAEPVAFAEAAASAVTGEASGDPAWLASWQAADQAASAALTAWQHGLAEPFEGAVANALEEAVPADTVVLVGNSMPVRDLDAFLAGSERSRRIIGNRGASGIDGLIATALGLAAGQPRPVVLVLGDLAFLHDLTSIAAAQRLGLDLTVVLVNNDGGGIFSFLPQGAAERPELGLPEHYEELFGTPHGLDLCSAATALGASCRQADPGELAAELAAAVEQPGLSVVELRTDRARNVVLHREAFAAVEQALEALA